MLAPFDHPDVIAGQGTLGLEILEQAPDVGTVLIPLSGGGLFSGVALTLKSARPGIVTVGVSMENGCAMHASLPAGKPVRRSEEHTYGLQSLIRISYADSRLKKKHKLNH